MLHDMILCWQNFDLKNISL